MSKINKLMRVDRKFGKELEEIRKTRLEEKLDIKPKSDTRLTMAIRRHHLFPSIKKDITVSDLKEEKRFRRSKMNKKGAITDLILWLIISFVVVIFLGVWTFGFNILSTELGNAQSGSDLVNISEAAAATFGQVNSAMPGLRIVAFVIIFALAISIFISNALIKANPVFFIVYVLITVVSVIFAAILSNAYEELLMNDVFGATLLEFTASNHILLNFPLYTTIIGLFGAVFLFAGVLRDSEGGGGVV